MKDVFRRYNSIVLGTKIIAMLFHASIIYYCLCESLGQNCLNIDKNKVVYMVFSILIVSCTNAISNKIQSWEIHSIVSRLAIKEYPGNNQAFNNKVLMLFEAVKNLRYPGINIGLRDLANFESRFYSGSSEKFMVYNIYLDLYRYKISYIFIEVMLLCYSIMLIHFGVITGVFLGVIALGLIGLNMCKVTVKNINKSFDSYLWTFDSMFLNAFKEESRHD